MGSQGGLMDIFCENSISISFQKYKLKSNIDDLRPNLFSCMKSKVIEKVNNLKLVAEINNVFDNYQLAQPFFMAN